MMAKLSASVYAFGRPSHFEEHRILRQLPKAVATVAAESCLATGEQKSVCLVGAVNALVMARAAVEAANDAAALSSKAEALENLVWYYSMEDMLRLEQPVFKRNTQEVESRTRLETVDERVSSACVDEDEFQKSCAETSGRVCEEESVVRTNRRWERRLKREHAKKKRAQLLADSESQVERTKRKSRTAGDDDVEMVLTGMKKKRLLTVSEEGTLARGVQELLVIEKAKVAFMKKAHREPTLKEWANAAGIEETVFKKRLWLGRMCKGKMISCNIGLVTLIAKKYQDYGVPLDDLVQEGCLGLIRGIEKFDPSRGYKLSTYAYWWIKQAIGKAAALKSQTIKLPAHSFEVIGRIKRARRSIYEKQGRSPEDEEVAEAVGVSVTRMHALMNYRGPVRSLDKPVGRKMDVNLQDVTADDTYDCCENVINRAMLKADVDMTLRQLKPQEQEVMRLRYGLHGGRPQTLEEIGYMYNVTRERIRQIEVRAMHRLKTSEMSQILRLHFNTV